MKKTNKKTFKSTNAIHTNEMKKVTSVKPEQTDAFSELEQSVFAALKCYSNVHRGSGIKSMVSTHLYEEARDIILEYLGLNKSKFLVIFCTPRRAEALIKQLKSGDFKIVSSQEIGLAMGLRALAIKKSALPSGAPFQTGGGTTRLISQDWIIWAKAPDKFEAGTPAIINVITFAKALLLVRKYGKDIFQNSSAEKLTIDEILSYDELEEYSGLELLGKLRETQIGHGILVPSMEGVRPYINLDNSASTPTFTAIWKAFRQTWSQNAQLQQEIVQEVKTICAGFLNAPQTDYDVIFTSNTTEAINLAAESLSHEGEEGSALVVVNTVLEHSSNELPWRLIPQSSLIPLSVDAEGFMDLEELESLLITYNQNGQYGKKRIKLVAISGASNVLGVCNNIAEISRIVHKYDARFLVDAAQLIAHSKIDMEGNGIDYLVFSAHKVYAPFGSGALVVRQGLLNFSSDEQELIRASGEENTAGIAALGKSLSILQRIGLDKIHEEEQILCRRALLGLSQLPGLTIYGIKDPDSLGFANKIGVIAFGLKGMMADKVAKELALQGGIGVRHGCLCAHIIVKRLLNVSPGLEKFQRIIVSLFPKLSLPGIVRVSLGIENSEEELDALIDSLRKITNPDSSASKENGKPNLLKADVEQQMKDFVKDSSTRVYQHGLEIG